MTHRALAAGLLAGIAITLVPGSASAVSTKRAAFGKSIVLHGAAGERVRVRPYEVVDPLPAPTLAEDDPAFRYVGVRLSITNVGARTVRDSPSNGAVLVTGGGVGLNPELLLLGDDDCDSFGGSVTIPRGQTRRGCIGFKIPTGASARFFELTWDSGFAGVTGQWSMRRVAPSRTLTDTRAQSEANLQRARTLQETIVAPTASKAASAATCERVSRLRFACEFSVTTRPKPRQPGPTVVCGYKVGVRMARTGPAEVTSTRSSGACASPG